MFEKFFDKNKTGEKNSTQNPFGEKTMSENEEKQTDIEETSKVEEETQETTEEETQENKEKVQENVEVNELDALKQEHETLKNQYLRLAADFDNFRKRQAQEREALLKYGATECMKKVIEVVDNFDRAMQSVDKIEDIEKMKEAFTVLNKQLIDSLTKLGLERIETQGQVFDPNLHEAVMKTPTSEYPEETIINELQKGYKMGDKVLRPALVNVAVSE